VDDFVIKAVQEGARGINSQLAQNYLLVEFAYKIS
jgi:hypothetical protein